MLLSESTANLSFTVCYKATYYLLLTLPLMFTLEFVVCYDEPDLWAFLQDDYVSPQKYSYCICFTHTRKKKGEKRKIPI